MITLTIAETAGLASTQAETISPGGKQRSISRTALYLPGERVALRRRADGDGGGVVREIERERESAQKHNSRKKQEANEPGFLPNRCSGN